MRVLNKNIWPYQIEIKNQNLDDVVKWCQEKLYHGGHYEPNWCFNDRTSTWCFKDDKEFTMFCLRWA